MFRKSVRFIIRKEDVNSIIDTLSIYGAVEAICTKDGKGYYSVSIVCEANRFQRVMDDILMLNSNGVSIRKLNISWKLFKRWP